jgi:capsule polysaccharide modification protein KpsS
MLNGGIKCMNRDIVAEANEDMLFADGFDDALVGYIERAGMPSIACYDKDKCIEILAKDMTYEEAVEYFYFNTAGAYVGENTPCFFTRIEDEG